LVVVFAVVAYWLGDFETGPDAAKMVLKYVPKQREVDDTYRAAEIRQRTANQLVQEPPTPIAP